MANREDPTKARLKSAAVIAEEVFGQDGKNPVVIAAVLRSLARNDMAETNTKLGDKLYAAAAVASGS